MKRWLKATLALLLAAFILLPMRTDAAAGNYETIQLTAQNWEKYFQVDCVENYNALDAGTTTFYTVDLIYQLVLREEYRDRLSPDVVSTLHFSFRFNKCMNLFTVDLERKHIADDGEYSAVEPITVSVNAELTVPYNPQDETCCIAKTAILVSDNNTGSALGFIMKDFQVVSASGSLQLKTNAGANSGEPAFSPANTRDWNALLRLPYRWDIDDYNQISTSRSPYLSAWMQSAYVGRFDNISVDFKADYLPVATYCCLANFYLDYPYLEQRYNKVYTGSSIGGYAGFQHNLEIDGYNSILSLWDILCEDRYGNVTVYSAKQTYPAVTDESRRTFDEDGTGVHCSVDYPWKAGKWYRMLLQCGTSETTGNTTVLQWVCDLENGRWTRLCEYDMGFPDVAFKGNTAVFLENFTVRTSGEIRTMEIRNYRVRDVHGKWIDITNAANVSSYFPSYIGSYQYGSDGTTLWFITTGISGCAPKQGEMNLKVRNLESGSPY